MPLYFPPQANPPAPEPPPIELGRCRYCESMTTRHVIVAGLEVAYVCPRSECMKDFEREVAP